MKYRNLIFCLFMGLIASRYVYSSSVILTDLQGRQISFSHLKGKWVLINYWASWCHPCLDEISELNRFYAIKKNEVALFAVNYDSLPLAEQVALINKYKINYPSLQEDPASALQLGDIPGVPVTFIFNPQGSLTKVLYGGQTVRSLNEALA